MKEVAADIRLGQSSLEEALVKSATRAAGERQAAIQYHLSDALRGIKQALELAEMREGQG